MMAKVPLLKVDFHVHTIHSDGRGTVIEALEIARKKGLDGLAITDHETLGGFLEAKSCRGKRPFVLPGYEVHTDAGHIVVLGLETLPKGSGYMSSIIPYEDLLEWVRDLGGLAILAHPAVGRLHMERWSHCRPDAVEALNASYPIYGYFVPKGLRIAEGLGVPGIGGSDAHYAECVGDAYTVLNLEFDSGFEARNPRIEKILEAFRSLRAGFGGGLSPIKTRIRVGFGYAISSLL